jgi:hypothetical protein
LPILKKYSKNKEEQNNVIVVKLKKWYIIRTI